MTPRDMARPVFLPSAGTRDAAERFLRRHGLPAPDWSLRERAVARVQRGRGFLSPREERELERHLLPCECCHAPEAVERREWLLWSAAWIAAMVAWTPR